MAQTLYGPPIYDAIKRGDKREMQTLLQEAKRQKQEQGDLDQAISDLERALSDLGTTSTS
jgi:Domain of unknown function (DUF1843)